VGKSNAPQPDLEPVTCTVAEAQLSAAGSLPVSAAPERIAGRYIVQAELGRGGMAVVYRVHDPVSGRQLALKHLILSGAARRDQGLIAAFEREFHTLVQLAHPRIIEVYDFGTDAIGLFYTMELLDGGDLRERAPLEWRQACTIAYGVCSSLALLHARRLVHRDVSPRNVRSTSAGAAKLIDFGALAPMGAGGQAIGTPPFVPPEVLHRSTLDGRTDLYSLGATLYYGLTGRFCYPARDFAGLQAIWAQRPPPPSAIVPDVPPALDALVMSMISLDPATRPRSAFEVMERLAALAQIEREASDVSQAYLSTPTLVGRDALLADVNAATRRAIRGRGKSLLIQGAAGVGRTRVLDACALDAKISGAVVLRVNGGSDGSEPLAVGMSLAAQVALALPEHALAAARSMQMESLLFEAVPASEPGSSLPPPPPLPKQLGGSGVDLRILQPKLTAWLTRLSDAHPLAILIDDLHEVDEASLALLAALALGAARRRLLVLATSRAGARPQAPEAFAVFQRACSLIELPVLSRPDVDALAASMFGDVPNLALLSERLYQVAAGNARETLEVLQTLIARRAIRYESGQWLLPERLATEELPSSALERCKARVAELSPLARQLAEAHSLASHASLSRQEYAVVACATPAAHVDAAISELVSKGLLAGDGQAYVLSRYEWASVLDAGLSESARASRHHSLAELYAESDARVIERVRHLLAAGREALALDLLVPRLQNATSSIGILALTSMSTIKVADVLDSALASAQQLGRTPAQIHELRRGVFAIAVVTDEARYFRVAPTLLAQLKHDSGLAMYESISDAPDPMQRLMRALTHAKTTYDAAPANERVLSPEAAIKGLAYFVAISIAVGSRAQDHALIASLPALLEPFAALSPLLHAMWQNSIATRESICDNMAEKARARWLEVEGALAQVSVAEMSYVDALRSAIAYGIALIESRLGIATAEAKAKALDGDPMQRASGMSLRRIARLHKGDFVNAERYRKQAELLALHGNQRQMFTSTLVAELIAHAIAGDLSGIREACQAIEAQAARFPGWAGYQNLAEGYFELTRGQLSGALAAFERGLVFATPDPKDPNRCTGAWLRLESARLEALVGLGRSDEACTHGKQVIERCDAYGIGLSSFMVRRALALAEAKQGDFAGACARLERVMDELTAFGIEGLELGATYEARTRIAIWASDRASAEHFGRLTAQEYRYGQDSPLGARYERLWDEARIAGVTALPELQDIKSSMTTSHQRTASGTVNSVRSSTQEGHETASGRTLQSVCETLGARSGHLYRNTAEGFELVSSHGEADADPVFQELIARRFSGGRDQGSDATVIEPEGFTADFVFRDRRGAAFRAKLLMGEVRGVPACAGAVVLDSGSRAPADTELRELLSALTG